MTDGAPHSERLASPTSPNPLKHITKEMKHKWDNHAVKIKPGKSQGDCVCARGWEGEGVWNYRDISFKMKALDKNLDFKVYFSFL